MFTRVKNNNVIMIKTLSLSDRLKNSYTKKGQTTKTNNNTWSKKDYIIIVINITD